MLKKPTPAFQKRDMLHTIWWEFLRKKKKEGWNSLRLLDSHLTKTSVVSFDHSLLKIKKTIHWIHINSANSSRIPIHQCTSTSKKNTRTRWFKPPWPNFYLWSLGWSPTSNLWVWVTKSRKKTLSPKWGFPKIGVPPNHPILIGFFIINHPFWGSPIFGNLQICWASKEKNNSTGLLWIHFLSFAW